MPGATLPGRADMAGQWAYFAASAASPGGNLFPPPSPLARPNGTTRHRQRKEADTADFVLEVHRAVNYVPDMSQTLEKRVKGLEKKTAGIADSKPTKRRLLVLE
jgi:hypothetical protein